MTNPFERDLEYYATIDKVYWVPVDEIETNNGNIPRDTPIPCIFVEEKDDKMYILQFDMSIENDMWIYTAWRKVIGTMHDVRVNVLLIHNMRLYMLDGTEIMFDDLGRSNVWIDKEYLGKCGFKGVFNSKL
jgi:hypothetical protein